MSTVRAPLFEDLPEPIKRAFSLIDEAPCREVALWRAVAMRAVLDGLGYTGATDDPNMHNRIIRDSRLWFRTSDMAEAIFDLAGIDLKPVRRTVLETDPGYRQPR